MQLVQFDNRDAKFVGDRAGGDEAGRSFGLRIQWVEPRLVGEIEYRAFTRDRHFRHPSWRGLRPDRDPREALLPMPT